MNHKLSQGDHDKNLLAKMLGTFLKPFIYRYFSLRLFFVNNKDGNFRRNGDLCGCNRFKTNAARIIFVNVFCAIFLTVLADENDIYALHPGSFRCKTTLQPPT